jgi:hypothetical protein
VRRHVVAATPDGPRHTGRVFVLRGPVGGPFHEYEETLEP